MSKSVEAEISQLLDDAEARHSCALAPSSRLQNALLRRVASGELVSPAHGLFVRASTWQSVDGSPALRSEYLARGLGALHPTWTFCGPTAAAIHGLRISYPLLQQIHASSPTSGRIQANQLVQRHFINTSEACEVNGLRVTTLERTALDCLRTLDFADALAVGDAAAAKLGWDDEQLFCYLKYTGKGLTGIRKALDVAKYVDARSESGGESIARAAMIELGYVIPKLQVWVENPLDAAHPFRVDGMWILSDGTVVIFEMDGNEKRENPEMTGGRSATEVLADERQRESLLSVTGARVLRLSYADVCNRTELSRRLNAFGVPLVRSSEGYRLTRAIAPMEGGLPAENGAIIRDGWLRFEPARR